MTRVIITGARGRMGQALLACAPRHPELHVVGKIDVGDSLESIIEQCDVVIDFSFHDATSSICSLCRKYKKALVIGTTGHAEEEKSCILGSVNEIPVVWASNYSTGVNTLFWLTRKAAEI